MGANTGHLIKQKYKLYVSLMILRAYSTAGKMFFAIFAFIAIQAIESSIASLDDATINQATQRPEAGRKH